MGQRVYWHSVFLAEGVIKKLHYQVTFAKQQQQTETEDEIILFQELLRTLGPIYVHEVFHLLRKRKNINQATVAFHANLLSSELSSFENGKIDLPLPKKRKILAAINSLGSE